MGQGIFGLSESEKLNLSLTNKELEIIKPYYTSIQLKRYYGDPNNKLWLIYTDSKFKNKSVINNYPNIKKHLDKFSKAITSDNKPYGLHRAREERFFVGEKIISLRKCSSQPFFTYTDFDCYVPASFYIIKTGRINLKYLTALLNSKLITFWLRHKGKMQGNNYQIDKQPLMEIPIVAPKNIGHFVHLVDKILLLKSKDDNTDILELEMDILIYKLYELTFEDVKMIDVKLIKAEFEKHNLF